MADVSLSQKAPIIHMSDAEERALSVCLGLAKAAFAKQPDRSETFIDTTLIIRLLCCKIALHYHPDKAKALHLLHDGNDSKNIKTALECSSFMSKDLSELLMNLKYLLETCSFIVGIAFANNMKNTEMGLYAENEAELSGLVARISNYLFNINRQ